jgi:hypothetical protein
MQLPARVLHQRQILLNDQADSDKHRQNYKSKLKYELKTKEKI